jgi:hypothetical protein
MLLPPILIHTVPLDFSHQGPIGHLTLQHQEAEGGYRHRTMMQRFLYCIRVITPLHIVLEGNAGLKLSLHGGIRPNHVIDFHSGAPAQLVIFSNHL